jgi:alpha-tubulin suppressor-like RCC1 family protein
MRHAGLAPGPGFTAIASDDSSFCARTTSGGADCWGEGEYGQLGDGNFYPSGHQGSAVPVQVKGVGGVGLLSGVAGLVTGGGGGYCALLASGGADCWGYDYDGQLGNGHFYPSGGQGSAVPVQVEGVGGTGLLSGVASITSDGGGYCALLASGGVDCWGDGYLGQLGDGHFYSSATQGSAVPVQVEGVGGTGTLTGAASLTNDSATYCTVLTSGGADCWGGGYYGQLGDGRFYTSGNRGSAVPVQVK